MDIDRAIYNTFFDSDQPYLKRQRTMPGLVAADIYQLFNATIDVLMPDVQRKLQQKCAGGLSLHYSIDGGDGDDDGGIHRAIIGDRYYSFFLATTAGNKVATITANVEYNTNANTLVLLIDSLTETEYRGKKYNLLLRAFIVHLAFVFSDKLAREHGMALDVYVMSQALNPVSFYTLAKYFAVEVMDVSVFTSSSTIADEDSADAEELLEDALNDYLVRHNDGTVSYDRVERYYKRYLQKHGFEGAQSVMVDLRVLNTVENNNNAVDIISRLLDSGGGNKDGLGCIGGVSGGKRRTLRRRCKRRNNRHTKKRL